MQIIVLGGEDITLFLLCQSKFMATEQAAMFLLHFAYLNQSHLCSWTYIKHEINSEAFSNHFKNQIVVVFSPSLSYTFLQTKSSDLLLITNGKFHQDHENSAHSPATSKMKRQRDLFFLSLRSSSKLLILADLLPLIHFSLTAWVMALKCLVTL